MDKWFIIIELVMNGTYIPHPSILKYKWKMYSKITQVMERLVIFVKSGDIFDVV